MYYTRSRKVNGRVVREYFGCGPVAELSARMDARDRSRREEQAAAFRAERERLDAADAATDDLSRIADLAAAGAMTAAGYHRHNRGEWRRRRRGKR
jgi:hypothetical protein